MRRIKAGPEGKDLVAPSPRELAVLRFIGLGCSNKEIAARMHITVDTVKTYIRLLRFQLELNNRGELTRWVMLHPEIFQGNAADMSLHLPGCQCSERHCVIMRQRDGKPSETPAPTTPVPGADDFPAVS